MNNYEEEQAVLGSIIMNNDNLADVLQILSVQDFEHRAHQGIYWAMLDLDEHNQPIDEALIGDRLKNVPKKGNILMQCGGRAYLGGLIDHVPSNENVVHYARIVKSKSDDRQKLRVASEAHGDTVQEQVVKLEEILAGQVDQNKYENVHEIVPRVFDKLQELSKDRGVIPGIPTGLDDVDKRTHGLKRDNFRVVAARPSMGKTAYMVSEVLGAAKSRPLQQMVIFSMEMSKEELLFRMIAFRAKVDLNKIATGDLEAEDWDKLAYAIDNMPKNVIIDDRPALSPQQVKSTIKQISKKQEIGAVWIDYLQLMKLDKFMSSEQEVSIISGSMKALAKTFHFPVTALSQLNRDLEKRQDRRPQMSDLRSSGSIEQDADIIIFIYRDEVYNPDSGDKGIAEIIMAKVRQGEPGTARLGFIGKYTQFRNIGG